MSNCAYTGIVNDCFYNLKKKISPFPPKILMGLSEE